MDNGEEIPRVATFVMNVNGMGYHLTNAQVMRKKRGKSIYQRDRKVAPYEVRKGKWV